MTDPNLQSMKLYARNLTARADALVRGNPVTTRPEDGVENCFPGLEFDQRNLDKAFLPGLTLEWHHDGGVVVRDFDPAGIAAGLITAADIAAGLFVIAVRGVFASRLEAVAPAADVRFVLPPAGLDAWRLVRDIEPGEVAIFLATRTAFDNLQVDLDIVSRYLTPAGITASLPPNQVFQLQNGRLIRLVGQRATYLTADGVIDPNLVPPGVLTQSLCAPWQYDFADCGCFYWAANKPDVVSNESQPEQVLNFQRRDRSPAADRATGPQDWVTRLGFRWDRDSHILRHAEMIGRWSEMAFVIDGRETDRYTPTALPAPARVLTRAEIVARLKKLAPVEHALSVEYLYAHYSLRAGRPPRPTGETAEMTRIFTAAQEVFAVAVDEMRHIRAVNEILIELGEPWTLARAAIIGEDFDGTGRVFAKPFELLPLTQSQLMWFIDVERASPVSDDGGSGTIDGMYTQILRSIEASNEFTAQEKSRFAHLIKIIIDEGVDHFDRFTAAQQALAGISESAYLRFGLPARLPAGQGDRLLQDATDAAYVVVLRSLDFAFKFGDQQRGAMVEAARRAMFNMDDAARSLADRGHTPMFDMTGWQASEPLVAGAVPVESRRHRMTSEALAVADPLRAPMAEMQNHADPAIRELARRMKSRSDEMMASFAAMLDQS